MPLKPIQDDFPPLNLTSMIDVLMVLIIFLIVATRFVEEERRIDLKVPQVGEKGALTAAPEKKVVNVYRDGEITLDQKPVSLEELTERLTTARTKYKGLGVLVRGDGDSPFQRVASVLAACKQAGISDLGISVQIASAGTRNARR